MIEPHFHLLGKKVRDVPTRLAGTVLYVSEHLSGTVQGCIQPAGDGEKLPEAYCFDVDLIEVVDDHISAKVKKHQVCPISVGQKVRDTVAGIEGVVMTLYYHINGCVRVSIQPPPGKDGKVMDQHHCDHKVLKVVDDGVSQTVKRESTGGPHTRAIRF